MSKDTVKETERSKNLGSKGDVIAFIKDHLGGTPITVDEMENRMENRKVEPALVTYGGDLIRVPLKVYPLFARKLKEVCVHECKRRLVEHGGDSKDYAFFIKFPFGLAAHCKGTVPYPKGEEHIWRNREEEISE